MASQDLRSLEDEALVYFPLANERELVARRFKHSQSQLENTASLRDVRRDIARARTELRAREISTGAGPNTLTRAHRGSYSGAAADQEAPKSGFLSGVVDKLTADE